MADGSVIIDTRIDTKNLDKGIKQTEKSLGGLAKRIAGVGNSSTLKGLSNIGASFTGISGAVSMATGAVKTAVAAIKDLSDAYNAQARAETQLEAAARNNPYLLSENVARLKEYAGELQSMSTYGDEALLPLMAQLAGAGRTQQEIMDVMAAAVNVAAGGSMSLDSAVRNLNKTFSGLSGELGESVPQIKALTAEQLKNGEAVRVLARQYEGMAESVARTTGSGEQLRNAWGDLKEALGAPFEKAMGPVRGFFTEVINGWTDALNKRREYEKGLDVAESVRTGAAAPAKDSEGAKRHENGRINDYLNRKDGKGKKASRMNDAYAEVDDESLAYEVGRLESRRADVEAQMADARRMLDDGAVSRKRHDATVKDAEEEIAFIDERLKELKPRLAELQKSALESLSMEDVSSAIGSLEAPLNEAKENLELYRFLAQELEQELRDAESGGASARRLADIKIKLNNYSQLIDEEVKLIEEKEKELAPYLERREGLRQKEADDAKSKERADADAEELARLKEEMERREGLRKQYDETVRKKQEEIRQRRANGVEISEEAEAQELYNTALSAYVAMMSDPAFKGNSGGYKHEKDARKDIEDWAKTAFGADARRSAEEFLADVQNALDEMTGVVKNQYDALLETLDAERTAVIENEYLIKEEKERILNEFNEKKAQIEEARRKAEREAEAARLKEQRDNLQKLLDELSGGNDSFIDKYKERMQRIAEVEKKIQEDAARRRGELQEKFKDDEAALGDALAALHEETAERMRKVDEAYADARLALFSDIMSEAASYAAQTADVVTKAANLMLETTKNNARAEQAALEEKYLKGEISEEEYNEKMTESKRKAAKEQYKIQMAQWTMSLLTATANIAEGVTKSIAQGGVPAGLILGGIAAAAGAAQIAAIVASKPIPPSFSAGGIVPGSSYSGDNIAANLNSREMVMNMGQQKGLWDFINGGSRGSGGGANIVINNSAANVVSAKPQLTRGQIEIMIDARVNESMRNGRYSQSMGIAQEGMGGEWYGI